MTNSIIQALSRVEDNLRNAKKRFQQGWQGRRLAQKALQALKRVPGAPIYPIRWTSERQRRAFFASKGFGRGIPASRRNPPAVTEGWGASFIPTDEGGIVALTNPEDHWEYVQGPKAQGYHKDTGWVQLDDVEEDFYREAGDAATKLWYETADPLKGL